MHSPACSIATRPRGVLNARGVFLVPKRPAQPEPTALIWTQAADAFVADARSAARSAAATAATMGKVAAGAALNTAAASKCPCSAPPWTLKAQTECHRLEVPKKRPGSPSSHRRDGRGRCAWPIRPAAPVNSPSRLAGATLGGSRAGAQGHSWHLPCPTCPCGSRRSSLTPVPLGHYLRPSERHPPEEAP